MNRNPMIRAVAVATLVFRALSQPAFCQVLINGAGATFPYPVYARWFDEFHRLRPDAFINYQSVGSGAGMRQLQAGVLDLGASDMPLSDAEIARFPNGLLHIPTVIGAVVPVYNIPGLERELNFTPEALSGILLGRIARWNHQEIAGPNPGVTLPDAAIVVVHRSDGSGTTYVLADFLSKTDTEWKRSMGVAHMFRWLTGIGAKGNEGVAGVVQQVPYAVGYVELIYAEHNRMTYGRVRNSSGKFIRASVGSMKLAAPAANPGGGDFRVSITNPPHSNAYPISSYTWFLAPARITDPAKRRIIVDFLRWMLRRGQRMAEPMGYAPLPAAVAAKALKACDNIR